MKYTYFGIDQSYTSNGMIGIKDGCITVIDRHVANKQQDIFEKCWNTSQHILTIIKQHQPDHIAIEGLAFGMQGAATRDLAGLQFNIMITLRFQYKYKGSIDIISPLSLKKFATGSGKAKKEDMITALPIEVQERFIELGFKKTTGMADLADAFWLAKYIQHKYKH